MAQYMRCSDVTVLNIKPRAAMLEVYLREQRFGFLKSGNLTFFYLTIIIRRLHISTGV